MNDVLVQRSFGVEKWNSTTHNSLKQTLQSNKPI